MNSCRFFLSCLGGFAILVSASSCKTTEDFSDFDLKIAESDEDKTKRMFANIDMTKTSAFAGKEFSGKEANLRSEFERKEFPEHPYFKLGKDKPFRKGNDQFNGEAREGKETANWQEKDNSWFKKTFAKRDARKANQISRKEFNVRGQANDLENRSRFEKKTFYGSKIIDQPNKGKEWTVEDVKELLNTY